MDHANPFDNYGEEYDRAAVKYSRNSHRPTIAETVAHYRERRIGLVMFTVDSKSQLGPPNISRSSWSNTPTPC